MNPPPVSRRRADVVVVAVLVGVFVIGLTAYGVVSEYLHRVDAAVSSMDRIEAVGAYENRPTPAVDNGPESYAVFATAGDGSLAAALVLHLDASRQDLVVIGVPSSISLPDGPSLTTAFAASPATATKVLEQLFNAHMNHQFALNLDACPSVIGTTGGITMGGVMDADQVAAYVDAADTPSETASRLSAVAAATLSKFTMLGSITDPQRFSDALAALTPCVAVDASLTSDEVQSTLVSLKIHPQDVGAVAALGPTDETWDNPRVRVPDTPAKGQARGGANTPQVDVPVVPAADLGAALVKDDFSSVPLARPSST